MEVINELDNISEKMSYLGNKKFNNPDSLSIFIEEATKATLKLSKIISQNFGLRKLLSNKFNNTNENNSSSDQLDNSENYPIFNIYELEYSEKTIKILENNNIKEIVNIFDTINLLLVSKNYKNNEYAIIEIMEHCFKHNISNLIKFIETRDINGNNLLADSIHIKLTNITNWILNKHELIGSKIINSQNNSGDTPLSLAIYHGLDNIIDKLLEFPFIKVNLVNNLGESALFQAIISKNYNVCMKLLSISDININLISVTEQTLLNKCITYSMENFGIVLLNKIEENTKIGKINNLIIIAHINNLNENLLISCCKAGLTNMTLKLIDVHLSNTKKIGFSYEYINYCDLLKKNALDYCAINNMQEVALKIIKTNKVDNNIHYLQQDGLNTVINFINKKMFSVVNELINVPSYSHEKNNLENDSMYLRELLYVCKNNYYDLALKMFNIYPINNYHDRYDDYHQTILMYCCINNWFDLTLNLVTKDSKTILFFKNKDNKTTLMIACETLNLSIIKAVFNTINLELLFINQTYMDNYNLCLKFLRNKQNNDINEFINKFDTQIQNIIKDNENKDKESMEKLLKEIEVIDSKTKKTKKKSKPVIKPNIVHMISNEDNVDEDNIDEDADELLLNSAFNKNKSKIIDNLNKKKIINNQQNDKESHNKIIEDKKKQGKITEDIQKNNKIIENKPKKKKNIDDKQKKNKVEIKNNNSSTELINVVNKENKSSKKKITILTKSNSINTNEFKTNKSDKSDKIKPIVSPNTVTQSFPSPNQQINLHNLTENSLNKQSFTFDSTRHDPEYVNEMEKYLFYSIGMI